MTIGAWLEWGLGCGGVAGVLGLVVEGWRHPRAIVGLGRWIGVRLAAVGLGIEAGKEEFRLKRKRLEADWVVVDEME